MAEVVLVDRDGILRHSDGNKKSNMVRTIVKYTDNKVHLDDAEVHETYKHLFPGVFTAEVNRYGEFENFKFHEQPKVFPLLPSQELENLQEYLDKFLSEDYIEMSKKAGIPRRSGLLLYGTPGIGKSNYINYALNLAIEKNSACVFNFDTLHKLRISIPFLKDLRNIQDNLFVVVFEEMDELINGQEGEAVIKNFMDGINSIDNCLILATTNYLERIPDSLKKRPSRFRKVLEIKQTGDVNKLKDWLSMTYKNFLPNITPEECESLHGLCLNKSIDEIKHILIDSKMGIKNLEQSSKLGFKKKS